MKRISAFVLGLLLLFSVCLAEDAVSSATLKMEKLPETEKQDNGILVAYFSPDDTVRAAAYAIADTLSAELFEIEPVEPYTAEDLNYFNSKSRSMTETADSQARPAIAAMPDNLDAAKTIILCYPIWGGQAPRIISAFLESADLTGKTIIPFATSNSSGIGNSGEKLRQLTGDSVVWLEGKGIKKVATEEDIRLWAETLKAGE